MLVVGFRGPEDRHSGVYQLVGVVSSGVGVNSDYAVMRPRVARRVNHAVFVRGCRNRVCRVVLGVGVLQHSRL